MPDSPVTSFPVDPGDIFTLNTEKGEETESSLNTWGEVPGVKAPELEVPDLSSKEGQQMLQVAMQVMQMFGGFG